MIELSELEMRILSELEEAGSEHSASLLNTVTVPSGDTSELMAFQDALRLLLDKDLIAIHMEASASDSVRLANDSAKSEIGRMLENYKYVPGETYWTDVRDKGPPFFQTPLPEIVATDAGYAKSAEILEEHGYRWWRKPG